jgi:hypothetical protein
MPGIFSQGCDEEKVDKTQGDRKTIISVNIKLQVFLSLQRDYAHDEGCHLDMGGVDKASDRGYNVTTLVKKRC